MFHFLSAYLAEKKHFKILVNNQNKLKLEIFYLKWYIKIKFFSIFGQEFPRYVQFNKFEHSFIY